jgi:hypothetical protein
METIMDKLKLKKGMIVPIYERPLTKDLWEGNAKLIRREIDDVVSEYWIVEFVSDKERVGRWIVKDTEPISG